MSNSKQPFVDWVRFGADVAEVLDADYPSRNIAAASIDGCNRGMISRAVHGQQLSVASYLLLCHACGLDAYDYWEVTEKQIVTAGVSRETLLENPSKQASLYDETLARCVAPRAVSDPASLPRKGSDARSRFRAARAVEAHGRAMQHYDGRDQRRVDEPVSSFSDIMKRLTGGSS